MKLLTIIDEFLIGCFLILGIAFFTTTPAQAQSQVECGEYCEDLCGTPTGRACQYTYCDGGPNLCFGDELPEHT